MHVAPSLPSDCHTRLLFWRRKGPNMTTKHKSITTVVAFSVSATLVALGAACSSRSDQASQDTVHFEAGQCGGGSDSPTKGYKPSDLRDHECSWTLSKWDATSCTLREEKDGRSWVGDIDCDCDFSADEEPECDESAGELPPGEMNTCGDQPSKTKGTIYIDGDRFGSAGDAQGECDRLVNQDNGLADKICHEDCISDRTPNPRKRKYVCCLPPDTDGDGIPDPVDNCPDIPNADQADGDGDGKGDACEKDRDNDGIDDEDDNCPDTPNAAQGDADGDGQGDECDDDIDNDGWSNDEDNCPYIANPDQSDMDGDGKGDVCDESTDSDQDGVPDPVDNCPNIPNTDQADNDLDGKGDVCDDDIDGDGIENTVDNCPDVHNPDQFDDDGDGLGDACDDDKDSDDEDSVNP